MKRTFILYMSLHPLLFPWKMVKHLYFIRWRQNSYNLLYMGISTNFKAVLSNTIHSASKSPKEPVKHLFQGSLPADYDSAVLGRGLRIYVSSKLSGNAQAAGPWTSPGSSQTIVTCFISFLRVSFYCDKYNQ